MRTPARLAGVILASCVLVACGGDKSQPTAKAPDASKTGEAAKPGKDAPAPAKAAAKPAEKVKVVEGAPPGGDDRYALVIDAPPEAKSGQESKVTVRVVPKDPWHMNLDFPTSLKVDVPAGVAVAKPHQKKPDAKTLDESKAEFAVTFTPDSAGDKAFTGKFKFAVCQDEACSPVTEDVEFKVAVK